MEAGAYVLGALSPAERSAYQRHMATCNVCRNEVADLAGLPGLLGRLDEATAAGLSGPGGATVATPPPAPPMLLPDLLGKVRTERARSRRRFRWRAGALASAAACLALLASLGVSMASQQSAPPGVVLASMEAVQQGEPVTAVIGYQAAPDGGTDIYMSCLYADASEANEEWTFQLVVYPRRQAEADLTRDWRAYPGEHINLQAHSKWSPGEIDRIEVRLANGTRLLSYRAT
jgi:hypothetical protein